MIALKGKYPNAVTCDSEKITQSGKNMLRSKFSPYRMKVNILS